MCRVVITGLGILSSIGDTIEKVLFSLKNLQSGIVFSQEMKNAGLKSNVWGPIYLKKKYSIKRTIKRFMNESTQYTYYAMKKAILDSCLSKKIYSKNSKIGLILGSGCGSIHSYLNFFKILLLKKKVRFITPYSSVKCMPSCSSALLGSIFKIYGRNYSINSACSSSSNCIIHGIELIKSGVQDLIFVGGGEEVNWQLASQFDAMGVLSSQFNLNPKKSSRAYDQKRDGFVISGGSGIIVLESLKHALIRKAKIYGEIISYSSTCDGLHITNPSKKGIIRCMTNALKNVHVSVDYLNTHGTSTKIGDLIELQAIKSSFKKKTFPFLSSTKSLTGHALGVSGVQEIIYIILMLKYNFIVPSINIENLDFEAKNMNIVQKKIQKNLNVVMSNNFGFGGSNTSIIIKKYKKFL
ncbi:beta-ketoacyl synthase N-terminal-like domain-containing protein [Buchnera aphidicola]|uniref:3-oxoacyl-[acyl-carrier-protein] synthase 1 n=1 Tax=Buchnera aphidicola subsp. Tuberolachnus salignus TaxID=98804 RepID=A0A170PBI1_BUCTT|nr:beta-ketoacyl synthase N-terminal-like domain-containing protein [Buchnera aphidicola]CUR53043.1 3-oxoacyl-[acyl-carrier-protein] synthase 1 [Buchnera aphidicola (Tuberolachnus salignus)]